MTNKSLNNKLRERPLTFLAGAFLAGFALAWVIFWINTTSTASSNVIGPLREKTPYKLIQPLLACQSSNNKNFREQKIIGTELQDIVEKIKAEGLAKDVSVYFQNLTNGHWTGINEDELYAPASLYKIVLLMAYLKEAEFDPTILEKTVIFTGQINPRNNDSDFQPMVKGQSYSINELLYRLIVYSDDDAKDYLHTLIDPAKINQVFTDLDLPIPSANDTGDSTSAKSYSIFFRTLYNATYLSQYMSESALELLGQVKFDQGLVSGIPATTTIAHKFGHRVFNPPINVISEELHDCGIIYKQDNPYFLCVMTKGSNLNDLESVIQTISKNVYENSQ